MTATKNLSVLQKVFAVITGAFMTGLMWRLRGNHGFGAKWGMFCVALTIVLLIFALYGKRKKMNYEMIPITAGLAAITAGGWGTLNSQMSGYLSSNAVFAGEEAYRSVEISTYSGVSIMLLLGFGWLPLFACAIGILFSKQHYSVKDYAIFIGTYYVVMLISSITIAHPLFELINPQAVEGAAAGLADAGFDISPMKAFITKLGSAAFAKPIPFCRNYFTSIKVISSAIGAVAASVVIRFAFKDKLAARISVAINAICALAITIADIPLVLGSDRGILAGVNAPYFIEANDWGLWEYFTGFILGFGIMLLLVLLPAHITDNKELHAYSPLFSNQKVSFFYNMFVTFLFSFGVMLSRTFGLRFTEFFIDDDTVEIIVTVVMSIISFIPCMLIVKKNMKDKGLLTPANKSVQKFSAHALAIYIGLASFMYFFFGEESRNTLVYLPYKELFTANGFTSLWNEGRLLEPALMLVSLAMFYICFFICTKEKRTIIRQQTADYST